MKTYTKKLLEIMKNIEVPDKFRASSPMKISIHENCAFSLPAGKMFSCPGETEACEDCYARKGRFLFTNVGMAYAKNWVLLNSLLKKKTNDKLIKHLLEIVPDKAKVFRISVSGDFAGQRYINAWNKVIEKRPDVLFWAYTRSFKYSYKKLLEKDNFNLFASTDDFNQKEALRFVKRYDMYGVKHAYGPWKHGRELPENTIVCPATNKRLQMKGACEKCKLCIVKNRTKKNIAFLKH